jgi:hypothetical protein
MGEELDLDMAIDLDLAPDRQGGYTGDAIPIRIQIDESKNGRRDNQESADDKDKNEATPDQFFHDDLRANDLLKPF